MTDEARCLQGRYNKGYSTHKGEASGVMVTIDVTPDEIEQSNFIDMAYNSGGVLTDEARGLMARYYKGPSNQQAANSGVAVMVPVELCENVPSPGSTRPDRELQTESEAIGLCATDYKGIRHQRNNCVVIPCITPERAEKRQNGRRFKEDGDDAFCLTATDIHGVAVEVDTGETEQHKAIIVKVNDLQLYAVWYEKYQCYIAIRKLLPIECFRLQGHTDEYFYKAQFVNSDSKLYKQAGNGVTVDVIEEIAKRFK